MDARQLESLAKRLADDPGDGDALGLAYQHGQTDPRAYAVFLEKAGQGSQDPASGAHWFTLAAEVWSTSLGDAHRAARALMSAVDKDPTSPAPSDQLTEMYRASGDIKSIAALLDRRVKGMEKQLQVRPELAEYVAGTLSELARLYAEELAQPDRAITAYKKAIVVHPRDAYAIYQARELLKAAGRFKEALPLFAAEQALASGDAGRQFALYLDEADVAKQAGDSNAEFSALRHARSVDTTDDAGLKQRIGAFVLERVQSGARVSPEERDEAAGLFVSLAETYDGEYGHSYAICALELDAGNERAAQLAMFYAPSVGREDDTAFPIALHLAARPDGVLAEEARHFVKTALERTGDDRLLEALVPRADADPAVRARGHADLGRVLESLGRTAEAEKNYRQALEGDPAHDDAVRFITERLRGLGRHAELRDVLLSAAKQDSALESDRHAWLVEVAALCAGPLGDIAGAIEANRQLVMMDPSDQEAADHLETELEKASKWDELAELVERRARAEADTDALVVREKRLAAIHRERRRDLSAAGAALGRAALAAPDDGALAKEAADTLEEIKEFGKAAELLAELLRGGVPGALRASHSRRLAGLLERLGHVVEAGGAYSEAASLENSAELWSEASRCFVAGEAWEQAARATSEERGLAPDDMERARLAALEAGYLERLGDDGGALLLLAEAVRLDPLAADVATKLEEAYETRGRFGELAQLLLSRAAAHPESEQRVLLRRRAAVLHRDELRDSLGMRDALELLLEDEEDREALEVLADDSEASGETARAIDFLRRLVAVTPAESRARVLLRVGKLLEDDAQEAEALGEYRAALQLDPASVEALSAVASLEDSTGEHDRAIESYQKLIERTSGEQKLSAARRRVELLLEQDDKERAHAALELVRSLDPDDFENVERLRDLSEELERWEDFVRYQRQLIEVEGDDSEAVNLALRLAAVLEGELDKPEDAMRALAPFARQNEVRARDEYVRMGDALGKKGEVALALLEWMHGAAPGPKRNHGLRAAFDRFVEVSDDDHAIQVGLELVRMKGAAEELARVLERVASRKKHLEALEAAMVPQGRELSGPPRAEEMVRQAEVLAAAGKEPDEAIQHGEQALTSVSPGEVDALLVRLAALTYDAAGKIEVFERQVSRCKSPEDRQAALCRAAEVAHDLEDEDRVQEFLGLALGSAGQGELLDALRDRVKAADAKRGDKALRRALARGLSEAGAAIRDGGKSRSLFLSRAAQIAYSDLSEVEQAFNWLTDALVAHVDEESLDQLVAMGEAENALARVDTAIGGALERVTDGPLVRTLVRRRYELRSEQLGDDKGAAEDLKRLYDLSPADEKVAQKLEQLYEDAGDQRGLVQLFEDQILRSRDQKVRGDLARKVALIWQDTLHNPREAADAWRRVLRMKAGDEEAKEGLERAKRDMRTVTHEDIARAEEETKRKVDAQQEKERLEVLRREAELAAKAELLRARHSQPPPPPTPDSSPNAASVDFVAPPPDLGEAEAAPDAPKEAAEASSHGAEHGADHGADHRADHGAEPAEGGERPEARTPGTEPPATEPSRSEASVDDVAANSDALESAAKSDAAEPEPEEPRTASGKRKGRKGKSRRATPVDPTPAVSAAEAGAAAPTEENNRSKPSEDETAAAPEVASAPGPEGAPSSAKSEVSEDSAPIEPAPREATKLDELHVSRAELTREAPAVEPVVDAAPDAAAKADGAVAASEEDSIEDVDADELLADDAVLTVDLTTVDVAPVEEPSRPKSSLPPPLPPAARASSAPPADAGGVPHSSVVPPTAPSRRPPPPPSRAPSAPSSSAPPLPPGALPGPGALAAPRLPNVDGVPAPPPASGVRSGPPPLAPPSRPGGPPPPPGSRPGGALPPPPGRPPGPPPSVPSGLKPPGAPPALRSPGPPPVGPPPGRPPGPPSAVALGASRPPPPPPKKP